MKCLFYCCAMFSVSGGLLGFALLVRLVLGKDFVEVWVRYLKLLLFTCDDVVGWLVGCKYLFCKYDLELGYLYIDWDFKEGFNGVVCRYCYD